MAQRASLLGVILLVLGLVGCDHATKFAAETRLAGSGVVSVVPGVLSLEFVENHDTAFSLTRALHGPWKAPLLVALAGASVLAMAFVFRRRIAAAGWFERVAIALVLAGGIGNLLDRARRGSVVDFIHVEHWPVFNVADVWVVLGGIGLLLDAYRRGNPRPPSPAAPS